MNKYRTIWTEFQWKKNINRAKS